MEKEIITVLITAIGSNTAISVAKAIRKQNSYSVRIIGVDIYDPHNSAGTAFCDKYYVIPPATDAAYIDVLSRICQKENVNILFPIIDIEVEKIAKNLIKFHLPRNNVWVSSYETVRICNDKLKTHIFFQQNNILTPEVYIDSNSKKYRRSQLPCIIKPRNGLGSKNIFVAKNLKELGLFRTKVKSPISQKYIIGKEYTCDVVCDNNSKALAAVVRERLDIRFGISYKGIVVSDPAMQKVCMNIAQMLKIIGPCNIQYIKDALGTSYILEVNPRFSASLALTTTAGLNIPLILLRLSMGEPIPKNELEHTTGIQMNRYLEEVYAKI